MKLVSWNINGIRAICEKPEWTAWFANTGADVIALQETKAEAEQIPEEWRNPQGWQSHWLSASVKKGYSGTGVLLRNSCTEARVLSLSEELPDFGGEGRLIHLEFEAFHFFNVYFPNGSSGEDRLEYKLAYNQAFLKYAEQFRKQKPIVVCGDFNIAHKPIDIARPKENEKNSGFLPIERAFLDSMVNAGYVDTFRLVHKDMAEMYSWWSYKFNARTKNVGWRIDYFWVSAELAPCVADAWIESDVRGSDHSPVGLELAMGN